MSEYQTIQEVATLLKVNPRTVRRWIHEGKVKAFKIAREWRIYNLNELLPKENDLDLKDIVK